MKTFYNRLRLAGLLLCGLVAGSPAQGAYPERPLRIVAPFPAGVSTDIVARTLAQALTARLGQTVIVENKAGADGAIGVMDVVRAKPDGYTLLLATNGPLSAMQHLRKRPPYDVLRDLTPVSDVGRPTFAVYVTPDTPARTLAEFIDYAKANPGKLNYASGNLTGQLSFAHIAMSAGLDMTHVPYKGETAALNDMFSGQVDAIIATLGTGLPMVEAGKLRVLAVIANERNPAIPDVPLLAESGFPDFPIQSWFGLMGPAGMPAEVVETLNQAVTQSLADPAVIQRLGAMRVEASPSTSQGAAQVLRTQLDTHGKIIREAGIPVE